MVKKRKIMTEKIDKNKVPQHIAIIMDGNGRWAESQSLPRAKGHIEGVRRVEEIVDTAQELGVKVITLFTFSTERPTSSEIVSTSGSLPFS